MSWRFWSEYCATAVIIEADRIKHSDPIFQALNQMEKGDSSAAQFVHDFSASEANKMLLTAVQSGRDIIMDGTFTWLEYVRQTIDMVRRSHKLLF